jgi:hypothetical protein
MSKQHFAFGGGAKRRRNWTQSNPTLPVNRPFIWTSAAVVFSVFAVGFIAAVSKATTSRPDTWALQSSIFNQAFAEFDRSEPATVAVRPVSPTIFARPAGPATQAGGDIAMAAATNTVAQAPAEQMAARIDPVEPWPRTAAKTAPAETAPRKAFASTSATPTECLPQALRNVLTELEARFGKVTIVSTTQLHTQNHSPGSARANLHAACKAVDIKTSHEPKDVMAFLRTRPEVGGTSTYGNRVVHFDLNASYKPSASKRNTNQRRAAQ